MNTTEAMADELREFNQMAAAALTGLIATGFGINNGPVATAKSATEFAAAMINARNEHFAPKRTKA